MGMKRTSFPNFGCVRYLEVDPAYLTNKTMTKPSNSEPRTGESWGGQTKSLEGF